MKDNYPTRIYAESKFIQRSEPVAYDKPLELSLNEYLFYVENGYLRIKDFFDFEAINSCLENSSPSFGLTTKEPKLDQVRSVTGLHLQEPFKSMSEHSKLVSIVKSLLGSDIYIHQSRINYKSGLGSSGWYWHSDFETWHSQDGMPNMRCLSAMIPLTPNTNCNGSLMVIPKSHDLFYSCRKEKTYSAEENFAEQKEGVPTVEALMNFFKYSNNEIEMITCNPTDLVLFDCNIIHVSTQNMTPLPRTNLFFVYNSIENKLQKPFSVDVERPEEMGTRKYIKVI